MGMFDYITCEYPLPAPEDSIELSGKNFNKIFSFQTKSLDSLLLSFKIKKDGSLWEKNRSKGWKHIKNFSGEIVFYDSYYVGRNEADLLNNDYWIEYKAVFINGLLKDICLVKFEATDNSERKSNEAELVKEELERRELWGRWYMKYGYKYYDRIVSCFFNKWRRLSFKLPIAKTVENWLRPL